MSAEPLGARSNSYNNQLSAARRGSQVSLTLRFGHHPRRRFILLALASVAFIGLQGVSAERASAGANAAVNVSVSGGELNIEAENDAPLTTQINYIGSSTDEWEVVDSFAVAGSNCEQVSSAVVRCPESGEDVDVDFDNNIGGSVTMVGADSSLTFDAHITLSTATDNVTASDGDDVITISGAPSATVNGDDINGLDGDDEITTGDGSDIIDGGDDGDTIVANNGNNIVNGGEFAGDSSDDADTITAGTLSDTIDGGAGGDNISGGDGPTTSADDVIDGAGGVDTINAGNGEDEVLGGSDGDIINGGGGIDDIDGGEGGDTIDAGDQNDDPVTGGGGDDDVSGGAGNDTLNGGANSDDLHGDGGDDTLENSDGADSFDGGPNVTVTGDTADYTPTSAAPLTIDIDNVSDDGRNCPTTCEGDDVQTSVENVIGDSSSDKITGSSAANRLEGAGGDDTLAGGGGTGADGGDRFLGGGNTDTVTYAARTSSVTADIDSAADDGASGENDEVETDVENLIGGSGADNLTGDGDNNRLMGGPGTANDTMSGLAGDDTMFGGDSTNTGADGADTFAGGPNASSSPLGDTVSYASRSGPVTADLDGVAGDDVDGDTIQADVENLTGGNSSDTLTGNGLNNILNGGSGNDTLAGGTSAGADGADTFIGGAHLFSGDTVTFSTRTGVISADADGAAGDDTDGDTVGADVENLSGGSNSDTLTGNDQENTLRGGPGTGNDTLSGLGEDDEFFGGTGENTGPDGADIFSAGAQGSDGDTVTYESRTDDITARIGLATGTDSDNIQTTIDNLLGGEGDDTLTGDGDPNDLRGNGGNDTVAGGAGTTADSADEFFGGAGSDTVSYATRTEDVDANLDSVEDDGDSTNCPGVGCEADDIAGDIENLTGGSGDDDLAGDLGPNTLDGGPGDDDLTTSPFTGPDGADTFIGGSDGTPGGQNSENKDRALYFDRLDDLTIDIGGGANDTDGDNVQGDIETVWGGEGNDVLTGDGDANEIAGRQGDDILRGGAGTGPDGADNLSGSSGFDTATYAARNDDLTINLSTETGPEGDTVPLSLEKIVGGSGDDSITGDNTDNTLIGGDGEDDLFALAGIDVVDVRDGGPDTADCGDDVDTATADESSKDTLANCETADVLPNTQITQRPNDRITGRRATYRFTSAEASQFQCKIDSQAFTSCASPKTFRNLSLGRHTVRIRAVDSEGDLDPTPAIDRFRRVRG